MRTAAIDFVASYCHLPIHLYQAANDCCCLYTQSAYHLQTETGSRIPGVRLPFFFALTILKLADYFQADGRERRSLY